MEQQFDHKDDLIGKVLAGEATAQEKLELERWRRESDAHEKYFQQIQTLFDRASSKIVLEAFDEDVAWKKVKSKLHNGNVVPMTPAGIAWPVWRIAAGVIILLGVGVFLYQRNATPEVRVALQSEKAIVNDTLPDGSVTVLNRGSELAYEFNQKSNTRKVKLKGEAFFEVAHEEEKPFLIETDEVLIKDIGTAFNVKAYPNSDTIEVFVESGEVQFYTLKNPGIHLKAGEVGIYNKSIKEFSRLTKIDTNVLAYKTKIFCFNNTELSVAIDMLNSVYDSHIVLANKEIARCRLTVNFNNDKIEDIVDILAETLSLTATRKEQEWVLDGSCEN